MDARQSEKALADDDDFVFVGEKKTTVDKGTDPIEFPHTPLVLSTTLVCDMLASHPASLSSFAGQPVIMTMSDDAPLPRSNSRNSPANLAGCLPSLASVSDFFQATFPSLCVLRSHSPDEREAKLKRR